MNRLCSFIFTTVLCLSAGFAPAQAMDGQSTASDWVNFDQVRVRLISSTDALGSQNRMHLGVEIQLEEGWKTYWRSPGDTGVAPVFTWDKSLNVRSMETLYPAPKRFVSGGFETIGYAYEVIFPVVAEVEDVNQDATFALDLDFAVCADVCLPLEASLTLTVPAGAGHPTPQARTLYRFLDQVPQRANDETSFVRESRLLFAEGAVDFLIENLGNPEEVDLLIEGQPEGVVFAKEAERDILDETTVRLRVPLEEGTISQLAGLPLRLTILDEASLTDQRVRPRRLMN